MWPLRSMAFFALFVVMCTLSLVHPLIGAVNYIMIYQVNPVTSWWGRPLADLGIRFSLTAALFMGLGMALNWSKLPRVRPLVCTWQALLILLVCIACFSRLIGVQVTDWPTHLVMEKFIKLSIFVMCLTHLVSNRRAFNVLLWTLVLGSLVLGYDAYTAPRGEFISGRLESVGGPDFRASSGLAVHMAAMLPLIGAAFFIARNWRWRIMAMVAGAFTVNTIILCRTRSAFLALMFTGIVAVLLAPRIRRFRVWGALVLVSIASNSLADKHFWDRMATLQDDEYMAQDDSANLRKRIWAAAFTMIADYPYGVGCGNFPRVVGRYDHTVKYRGTHNTFILCVAELGVHGAAVFLLLLLLSGFQLWQCRGLAALSRAPPQTIMVIYGISLSMFTYLASGLFTERFYVESFWWVLAMPTCLLRAIRREVEETELEPELNATRPAWDGWGLMPAPLPG
ncbi:MAG: O-antigen ligase family protein [bacterium]|nr:O-antigen ligase family protein [bacterium]